MSDPKNPTPDDEILWGAKAIGEEIKTHSAANILFARKRAARRI
jgi:hypothetical protein